MTILARRVLVGNFLLTSSAGAGMLCLHWWSLSPTTAIYRASAFVLAMLAVHVIGWQKYSRQFQSQFDQARSGNAGCSVSVNRILRSNFRAIVGTQLPVLVLSALVLDGGFCFRVTLAATCAHWAAICLALIKRTGLPITTLDRWVIRWGLLPCLAIATIAAAMLQNV